MSKEKQIEEMAEVMRHTCEGPCFVNKDGFTDCEACHSCQLYDAGYRKQSEWISVDERLPETEGFYLVWNKGQKINQVRFFYRLPPNYPVESHPEIREYFGNFADYKWITHWMPLPEVPKGE